MKINSFNYNTLLFFLVRCLFIGICFNNLIIISKLDSWISILLGILISIFPLSIYYYINKKYPSLNIYEIINNNFISSLLSIFVFFFCATSYWNFINFISSQFLYKTPDILISLLFITSIIYINYKGLNTILRVSTILFYITVFIFITSFIGLVFQIKLENLMPIFMNSNNKIILGSLHVIAYNTLPLFMLLVIPNNYVKIDIKSNLFIFIFASFMLLSYAFFVLSIYGIDIATLLHFPEFHLLKRLTLMGFVKRLENIFSLQWAFDYFIFISFAIYFICQNPLIKKFKYSYIVISLLLVLTSNNIFISNTVGNNFTLKYMPYFIYLFFLILPIYLSIKKNTSSI
jgi:spore germination protein KB